jgi:hypothetical protein
MPVIAGGCCARALLHKREQSAADRKNFNRNAFALPSAVPLIMIETP